MNIYTYIHSMFIYVFLLFITHIYREGERYRYISLCTDQKLLRGSFSFFMAA